MIKLVYAGLLPLITPAVENFSSTVLVFYKNNNELILVLLLWKHHFPHFKNGKLKSRVTHTVIFKATISIPNAKMRQNAFSLLRL